MASTQSIATVFGGSGFAGRYVCQRLVKAGWRVRAAVRRPDEALFLRTYGEVGQVEIVQANIRDDASTQRAIAGAGAVINCVGILAESGAQSFDSVVTEGAARIARLAAWENAERLVHISAIGADAESESAYARSKASAEQVVTASFPGTVILRPSVVFGIEDQFFNRFAAMARLSPVLPVVGPDTRFQPVYVDDVAAAAVKAVTGAVEPGVYELGGPETASFKDLLLRMLAVIERRRAVMTVPQSIARMQGKTLDFLQRISFGAFTNSVLTADQVELLRSDNVVAEGARGFAELGIEPTAMEAVLEDYLYCFRPHGQYDAITASAKRLKV